MKSTTLFDGTKVFCLRKPEAKMLDHHVDGYLQNGITIKDGDVVLDIGANIGVFGVRALQKAANVEVHCFEPIPAIADVLRRNAEVHGNGRFHVYQCGVSSSNTTATFTYFPNTPALSTLHPEQWDENPGAFRDAVKGTMKNPPEGMKWMKWIPTAFSGVIASYLVSGSQKVSCELKPLSEVITNQNIRKIDLLKIDCEGAEWDVLLGIKEEHWSMVKSMVVEVHDLNGRLEKMKELLKNKGFTKLYEEREVGLEQTPMYNLFVQR